MTDSELKGVTELTSQLDEQKKRIEKLERSRDLSNSSIDGGQIILKDADGNPTARVTGSNGQTAIQNLDQSVPEAPSTPLIISGVGNLEITHDGLDLNGNPLPSTVKELRVYLHTEYGFEATSGYLRSNLPVGGSVTLTQPYGTFYVALTAVTYAGVESVFSGVTEADVLPLVELPDLSDTFTELDGKLAQANTDLTAHQGIIDQIEADLTVLDGAIQANSTNITNLQTSQSTLATDLDTAEGKITAAEQTLTQLDNDLSAAEGRITTTENNLTTTSSDVNTLKNTTIPAINTRLGSAEGEVTSLKNTTVPAISSRLATAENTLAPLPQKITNAEAAISTAIPSAISTAKQDAIAAAALDATSKANAAELAAKTAASLDAKAKADAAKAQATATAAQDAQAKADAAKSAAETAAKTYADTVASGASQSAIDAASADATAKANAAKQAAIDASALDAKAKADAAQAAAISAAAADATAKANSAKQDAIAAAALDASNKDAVIKQQALTEAAATAQTKVDAAKATLDAQITAIKAQGTSLIPDPSFESGRGALFNSTVVTREEGVAHTGDWSMKITTTGVSTSNAFTYSSWLPLREGRTVYVEIWVYTLPDVPAPSKLEVWIQPRNSKTGQTLANHIPISHTPVAGTWTKASGYFSMPLGYDEVRCFPLVRTTDNGVAGRVVYFDDLLVLDATEAKGALDAANAAQAKADSAHTLAGQAKSTADSALNMAGA